MVTCGHRWIPPSGHGVRQRRRIDPGAALVWAAGAGSADSVCLLSARGERADPLDNRSLTAQAIARQAGHAELAGLLDLR